MADEDEHFRKIRNKSKRGDQSFYSDSCDNVSGRNEEERMSEEQREEYDRKTTKLVLKDLPDKVDSEFIQLFFEKKKFGWFDVLSVEMDEDQSMALVELSDPEAVVKVLQQTPIKMYSTEIRVKPYFEVEEEDEPLCTICVCGLLGLYEETIELYFESERRAGGDEIENLNLIEDGKALITYKSEEVARRVVDKGNHVLNQQLLEVTLWQPPPMQTWNRRTPEPEPDLGPSDTIVVRGIGDSLDKETIEMYFENTKRSGGDEIKEMHIEEDVAFISYFSEEVAERVIHKGKHVLKKQVLPVMIWRETMTNMPTPDCELPLKPVSTVEVYGIDRSLDQETLGMYFENTKKSGGGDIENITVNYDGVASITFQEEMDFPQNQAVADQDEQLMKIQAKGKREEQANLPDMHGNASGRNQEEMVYEDQGEEEVRETTNKLILKDLPDAAYPEFIQLFFEKKRFGEFDVLNVEMDKDQSMALVEFNDPEGDDHNDVDEDGDNAVDKDGGNAVDQDGDNAVDDDANKTMIPEYGYQFKCRWHQHLREEEQTRTRTILYCNKVSFLKFKW